MPEVTLLAHIFHTHTNYSQKLKTTALILGVVALILGLHLPPLQLLACQSRKRHGVTKTKCLTALTERAQHIMIIITTAAVISLAPYLTDKGEHTTLSKINKNNYMHKKLKK